MRTVKRGGGFINVTCTHCMSIIEMLPDELSTVGHQGPFDCDYGPEEVGRRHFRCLECRRTVWMPRAKGSSAHDDDTYM